MWLFSFDFLYYEMPRLDGAVKESKMIQVKDVRKVKQHLNSPENYTIWFFNIVREIVKTVV